MASPVQPYNISYTVNGVTGIVTVRGQTGANNFVRTTFHDGTIAEGYADANGNFAISAQQDVVGNGLFRTVASSDGITTRSVSTNYTDVVIDVPVAIAEVDTDAQTGQVTVQGHAAPNAQLRVTFPDGQQINVIADIHGNYVAISDRDVAGDGQITIESYNPLYGMTTHAESDYIDTVDASFVSTPVLQAYTVDIEGETITVKGVADANTTITVYDEAGQPIAKGVADINGQFGIDISAQYNDGSTLVVKSSNASGRESDSVVFTTNPVFAADNQASVTVDNIQSLTATVSNQSKTFVKLISSPLLKFLGMGSIKGDFDFSVKQNHTQDLVATIQSLSVVALLDKTAIVLYKQQANGSWKPVANNKDLGLLDIIFFGEQATIKIKNLDAGNYKLGFESQPFAGVLNALTVNVSHIDHDLNQLPETNTTVQSIKGNVLTDASADGQIDRLGDNEDITLSVLKDGKYVDVVGSNVQVQGKYGVLTIAADGSYSYQAAKQLSTNAQVEEFSYKITHANGDSSIATLAVDFNYNWKGTVADDLFVSTAANDTITSGEGSDTLIYKVLDNTSNNGGNGHDTWTDFTVAKLSGDKIDVSDLLVGYNGNTATLSQYVSLSKEIGANGKIDTVVSIDRDGLAGKYQAEQLLTLHDVNTDLLTLINNGQIIA